MAVLASFGPITAFFTLSTTNYPFMKLLNVIFFAIAGVIGLGFLLKILRRLELLRMPAAAEESAPAEAGSEDTDAGAGDRQWTLRGKRTSGAARLFRVWLLVYAVVGAQMGWLLRPFIGDPNVPFTWFRHREANFFLDLLNTIRSLFGG